MSNKRRKLEINTDVGTNENDNYTHKNKQVKLSSALVSPDDERKPDAEKSGFTTPNKRAPTVHQFFEWHNRSPPEKSQGIKLSSIIDQAKEFVPSLTWDKLEPDKQLRLAFIILRQYPELLKSFMAEGSPYRPLLEVVGKTDPSLEEVLKGSLTHENPSGKRLGRLIRKGGDIKEFISEVGSRLDFDLPSDLWKDNESSTTIFNQVHPGGSQVSPFLRLQKKGSDLCYLIQSSNALYYHLMLRKARGDPNIKPFNLNNARHIRNIYSNELSCKHVFMGFGGNTLETIKEVIQLSNPNANKDTMLMSQGSYVSAEGLFICLNDMLKRAGPGIVNIETFDEFNEKRQAKFTGEFSTKTSEKHKGKHALLLVGVRRSTRDDSPNGGGYFGLFQNSWGNRSIFVEIGFDLLMSMKCIFHFINDELLFDNDFNGHNDNDERREINSMSSSPVPPSASITICERTGGTSSGMDENDEEDDDSESEGDLCSSNRTISGVTQHNMDLSSYFDYEPPPDGMICCLIN